MLAFSKEVQFFLVASNGAVTTYGGDGAAAAAVGRPLDLPVELPHDHYNGGGAPVRHIGDYDVSGGRWGQWRAACAPQGRAVTVCHSFEWLCGCGGGGDVSAVGT